ncbi:hypothetical protein [Streptomyces sp. NPDC058964]|uniref:hypothetical protein n=1 Tax=Streptomyces sp. NPDC058964 TaxID=3346681 RepID=UPI0036A76733
MTFDGFAWVADDVRRETVSGLSARRSGHLEAVLGATRRMPCTGTRAADDNDPTGKTAPTRTGPVTEAGVGKLVAPLLPPAAKGSARRS